MDGNILEYSSQKIASMAMIDAVYSAITYAIQPLSFSWIQVRISEALTPLPFLFGLPAVLGLTIGCFIANLSSPIGFPDIVFGPLLTLLAGFLSWKASVGKKYLACIYPILINGFGVSYYVSIFYGIPYWICSLSIVIGEILSAGLIGFPILVALENSIPPSWLPRRANEEDEILLMKAASNVDLISVEFKFEKSSIRAKRYYACGNRLSISFGAVGSIW